MGVVSIDRRGHDLVTCGPHLLWLGSATLKSMCPIKKFFISSLTSWCSLANLTKWPIIFLEGGESCLLSCVQPAACGILLGVS